MNNPLETSKLPASETDQVSIPEFKDEIIEHLAVYGYKIYPLDGKSIIDMQKDGVHFWSDWHDNPIFTNFLNSPSLKSQVAINPDRLFIPNSHRLTYDQQTKAILDYFGDITSRFPGIKAVMGNAATHINLFNTHLRETGTRLYGQGYEMPHVRTDSMTSPGMTAIVTDYDDAGVAILQARKSDSNLGIFALPIIVPTLASH